MSRKMRNLLALVLALLLVSPDLAVLAEEIAALRLPSSLKIIEEEAFYGDTSIGKVIVPEGATEIGERAFANSSLTEINLPDTLTSIADTAFEGLTDVTVTANEGSWAYGWATDKGYITASGFDLASLFVDAGRIVKRNGSAYWEAVPGTSNSSRAVGLEVDGDWSMSTDESWISIELTQPEDHIFNVSFKENRTGAKRTGTIRIATETDAKNLTVEQLPYLEARVVSPEALARDGKYEAYYDEEQDMFIDPKDGDYPVLSFGDIEVVYDVDAGTRVAGFYFNTPTREEGGQQYVGDSLRVSDTIPRYALVAGATGSQWLHTISLDLTDEEGNEYSTRYAFYVFGDSDWIAGYAIDEDSGEVLGVKIMGYAYAVEDAELAIPDTLWGDPVVQIGVRAFMENGYLTSVVIPNTVTSIEYEAFAYCENLTSVTLPESVTYIDDSAFDQCPKLKEINAAEGSYAYDWAMDHGLISREEPAILESAHPYAAGTDEEWTYQYDGSAYGLKVTFSELTSFCPNSDDMLVITDANGEEIAYTGYKLTGRSMFLPGTSFHLQLYTENEEGRYFGFRITAIEPLTEAEYKAQKNDFQFGTRTRADGTLRIVYCAGSADDSTELVVPETIGGRTVTAIGDSAFANLGDLTAITLPDSITTIGKYAFEACGSLASINLPDGISSIEDGTFSGCTDLTALTIPNSVTFIGDSAFSYCSSLTSLTIPEGVSAILPETFYGCSGLTNLVLPSSITSIGDYAFSDCDVLTTLMIPDGVKSIGSNAFMNCKGLTSIVLPDSVETIGEHLFEDCISLTDVTLPKGLLAVSDYAFNGCKSLTGVRIPDTVTYVGYCAFRDCAGLTSVSLPDGVSAILSQTFSGCSSLTTVNLPSSIRTIEDYAFYGCKSLAGIALPDGLTAIGAYAFGDCASLTALDLPNTLTSIDSFAFRNCAGLTNVRIPGGVSVISNSAFSGCAGLTEVTVADGVQSIQPAAFKDCPALTSVHLPASVTFIDDSTFDGCPKVTIDAPAGSYAYAWAEKKGCLSSDAVSLANVEVYPGKVVVQDGKTCWDVACSYSFGASLRGVEASGEWTVESDESWIFPRVIDDGSEARSYRINLNKNQTGAARTGTISIVCGSARETISIVQPASLEPALLNNTELETKGKIEIVYDEGQDEFVERGAGNCPTLSFGDVELTFEVPEEAVRYTSVNALIQGAVGRSLTNGDGDVPENHRVTCTIPETHLMVGSNYRNTLEFYLIDAAGNEHKATYIFHVTGEGMDGWDAYGYFDDADPDDENCLGMSICNYDGSETELVVPDTLLGYPVVNIDDGALAENDELTKITLPDSITGIGEEAFSGCSSLTSINIPDGVTSIERSTFSNCYALTALTLPDGVTSIGDGAFSCCYGLTNLVLPTSITSIGKWVFMDCHGLTTLTIPEGVKTIGEFAFTCAGLTSLTLPDSVESLGENLFFGCTSLTDVTLPKGLLTISNSTFVGCTSLTSVRFPEAVTSLGYNAFSGCSSLTDIDIPSTVTSIGYGAFAECSSLTGINIPNGVTSIDYQTFSECSSLTSINIPDSVTSIEDRAFENCSSLTSVYIPDSVTSIGDDVFSECSESLVIYGKAGSYAESYAKKNGLTFSTEAMSGV